MAIINTNISAVITQNAMAKNDRAMQTTMERLSTGKSVNSAQDDAAGIAVSSRMTSQIKGLDQAVQNAGDAISMIQTADGASIELGNMMQRMRELAVQATNGTVTTTDQGSLDLEFQQLKAEISRVANNSQWNGDNILDGTAGTASNGTATYQIGANAQQVMDVSFGDWSLNAPTSNQAAIYSTTMTTATANAINGMVTLSDGVTSLNLDYGTNTASPINVAGLISDVQAHPLYSKLEFTVAANAGGTGMDFTYKTAESIATPPTFTSTTGFAAGNLQTYTYAANDTQVGGMSAFSLTHSDGTVYTIDPVALGGFTSTEDLATAIDALGAGFTTGVSTDTITITAVSSGVQTLGLTVAGGVGGVTAATASLTQTLLGSADTVGTNSASNVTVSTAGASVAGVAAVYQTTMLDADVAKIDGNVVLSDGENSLTIDASNITTIAALSSAITSHKDHADLGFTVSTTAVVPASAAVYKVALTNAQADALNTAGTAVSISDGTTTITVTAAEIAAVNGGSATETRADVLAALNAKVGLASLFKYTITDNTTDGLVLTAKTAGLPNGTDAPIFSGQSAGHAVTLNANTGVDAIPAGLTFTYENPKAVLSTPTITADDGGVDIAKAVTQLTAGFTAINSVFGRDLSGISIATDTAANTALADLDAAMDGINAQRAIFGAGMNRLEYAIDNLTNGSQNAAASRSRIEDADYAKETTELARTQIIQQASTAMLAQANQSNQSVLSLLKG